MQQRTLTWLSRGFTGAALGVAAVVFAGWIFGIERWQNPVPGYVPMKCNTALAVLVLGVGVLLLTGEADKRRRRLAAALAVFVLLLAGVTTLEFLAGWNLGIDTLLAPELPGAAAAAYPGRMAPPTMFALLAGAMALLLLAARRAFSLLRALAGCDALLGFLVLLGYTFDARYLYAAGFATNVAFTTGAAFLFLGTSFFLLDPPSLIRSPHAGGVLFRRMLPFVILAPWIIGWASQRGAKAGLYDFGIDQVLCIAPLMALLMLVLVTVAASLDRSDRERARKAAEIDALNRELETRILQRTVELATANTSLRRLNRDLEMLRRCNRALVRATDEKELLQTICDLCVEAGGYPLAWAGLAQQDAHKSVRPVAHSGSAAAYLDEITVSWGEDDPFGLGPTGSAIRSGETYVCRNAESAHEFEPWHVAALRYGIRASIGLPLLSPQGAFGALMLYSVEPDGFDEREVELLQELADDLAFGIDVLRRRAQQQADEIERRRLEVEIQERQFYVRSLIESSLDAMMTTDPAGIITDVNQQMERLTGQPRSALIGAAFRQFCSDPERAKQGIEQVLREGKVIDYELTVRSADHRETPVSYNANTFHDAAGKLRGVFAAARDISERKRMERELADGQFYVRSLIESSLDAMMTTDPAGIITDVNQQMERLTGQPRSALIGAAFRQFCNDPARAQQGIEQVLREGKVIDYELTVRSVDSRETPVSYNANTFHDAAGALRGVFAAARDISERKRAEQEIRQLNADLEERVRQRTAELEASNKDLEAFTYSVSHDLRAPLRHLDGFSRLLLEDYGPKLEAGAVQHLTRIRDAACRLGHLVDDLLQFSRLGRHPLQPQITGLSAVVAEALADLAPETEGRDLQWHIGGMPYVECDSGLVKQVFANLLANAVKFTRPRSPAIIEVGQEVRNGEPVLFVRDNGVGFSMKYATKLFGVFQRLHRPEDFEGTGVGLATVKRIVQKHGGSIWAEAELDRGAAFYFTLSPSPAAPAAAPAEEAKERVVA